MLTDEELEKYVEELQEYATYERTEVGEYWDSLVNLKREMYCMSTPFKRAYQQEIISTLKFIKENYKWTTVTVTPNREPVIVKELEWVGDE